MRTADHNPVAEIQATPEAPAYTAAIEKILEEREQAQARERAVIEGLNTALAKIGYKIVPLRGATAAQEMPKRRGRPPNATATRLE